MKRSILICIGILALLTSKAQTAKDTISLGDEKVGYIDTLQVVQYYDGFSAYSFHINLFRDLTNEEESIIRLRYIPTESIKTTVNLSYKYHFKTNSAQAGHLLFEAGKLNTQAKNLYLSASLLAVSGLFLSELTANPSIGGVLTISSTGILSIIALVKSYKADKKMKQAGVLLQKM